MQKEEIFDVIIVGGSYAGLSAAMSLGRSSRKVLIIDSGKPCNQQTPHSHNFITQDGEKPAVISAKALIQVDFYEWHPIPSSCQFEHRLRSFSFHEIPGIFVRSKKTKTRSLPRCKELLQACRF